MAIGQHTPRRSIRIPDAIWVPAKAAARARGVSIATVVRTTLAHFATRERNKTKR